MIDPKTHGLVIAELNTALKNNMKLQKDNDELKEHFMDLILLHCGVESYVNKNQMFDHHQWFEHKKALKFALSKGWITESQLARII